jgi:hypothetical protein
MDRARPPPWPHSRRSGLVLLSHIDPLTGTDAAVTERENLEVEFGPAEDVRHGDERLLIAPNLRLNYGIAKGWGRRPLRDRQRMGFPQRPAASQIENRIFLKGVLREGVLPDQLGPSIATEMGVLLPGSNDQRGTGGSIANARWAIGFAIPGIARQTGAARDSGLDGFCLR